MIVNEAINENNNDIPKWEASKENILPIKRGRSVKGLNDNISNNISINNTLLKEEKEFELLLINHKDSKDNLLDSYIKYIKWTRDTYPSNNEKTLVLLERCTVELKDNEDLKNNIKFVKCWIEYADMVKNSSEIFAYMNSNKIGSKQALYWIAWAFVTEKIQQNYKLTDQIFQKGIRYLAEPKDLLLKRYQQFQRRLARYYLNMSEDMSIDNQVVDNTTVERKALNDIKTSRANTNSNHNIPVSSNTKAISHSRSKGNDNSNQGIGFSIFTDSTSSITNHTNLNNPLNENKDWKILSKQSEKRKENEGIISKWSDGPLQTQKPVTQTTVASVIPIFIDESCKIQEEKSKSFFDNQENKPGLSVRSKLDKPDDQSLDRIVKDPLARHKNEIKEPVISNNNTKSNDNPISSSNQPFTIFTENQLGTSTADNNPPVVNRNLSDMKTSSVHTKSIGFEIFTDVNVNTNQSSNNTTIVNNLDDILNDIDDDEDGDIPDNYFTAIKVYLNSNGFSGTLPNIEISSSSVYIQNNLLTGTIPDNFVKFNMYDLRLYDNQLTGTLPGLSTSLIRYIYISENYLTGNIPTDEFWIQSLGVVSISDNLLDGTLCDDCSSLSQIGSINIGYNYFTGDFLSKISASCSNLLELTVNNNFLTGFLENILNRFLFTGSELDLINLASNYISGYIPSEISKYSSLGAFFIGNNFITGSLPSEICSLESLRSLDITALSFCYPLCVARAVLGSSTGTLNRCQDMQDMAICSLVKNSTITSSILSKDNVKTLIFESDHLYSPNEFYFETISVEGATSYEISFDEWSRTEYLYDYIRIYVNGYTQFAEYWGTDFPGMNGNDVLVIPYEEFVVNFYSDGN
eukprot:gene19674-25592_t